MNFIYKIVKDILMKDKGRRYDNTKVLCLLSFIVYYCVTIISMLMGHHWKGIDFAAGNAALAVAFGISSAIRKD